LIWVLGLGLGAGALVALFYLEELARGAWAWRACERELRAQGVPTKVKAIAPPPVPDDQNFAMTAFLAPLFDFLPGTQTWRDTNAVQRIQRFANDLPDLSSTQAGWPAAQRTDFGAWLAAFEESARRHAGTLGEPATAFPTLDPATAARRLLDALKPYDAVLAELRTASQRPQARFNLRYDNEDAAAILLPHLAVLRKCTRVLALRASAELTLNQADAGLEDVLLAVRFVDALREEPLLISRLVRIAMIQTLLQPVWEGLADHRWQELHLARLQQRLQQFDLFEDSRLAFRGEQAFGNTIIAQVRAEPRLLGRVGSLEPARGGGPDAVCLLLPRGWLYHEQVTYNQLFEQYVSAGVDVAARRFHPSQIEQGGQQLQQALGRDLADRLFRHRLLSAMLLPAIQKAHQKFARAQTAVDQAVIACALERARLAKGQVPGDLASLAPSLLAKVTPDVVTGQPLKYQAGAAGSYVLYSVGWNEKDDGATVEFTAKPSAKVSAVPDFARGDWVWRTPTPTPTPTP
jgi:hypothetical protein